MPSISTELKIRVKNPKTIKGKNEFVTTVKTSVKGTVQETTLKRTIDGEKADLQLKFINHPDGTVEYVHIHCQTDYESSRWGKASGRPLEELYEFFQGKGSQVIRCKKCKRVWPLAGWATS
jgi:hypothetical protein